MYFVLVRKVACIEPKMKMATKYCRVKPVETRRTAVFSLNCTCSNEPRVAASLGLWDALGAHDAEPAVEWGLALEGDERGDRRE